MRCSDEIGVAGRARGGFVASGDGARTGLGLPAVVGGRAFFAVGRRAAFFAAFFRVVRVFPRVALLAVRFLRVALVLPLAFALPLTFFFVAIAAS